MSSSNQRPANRGFRSVLRCALSHDRQFPWLFAPEPLSVLNRPGDQDDCRIEVELCEGAQQGHVVWIRCIGVV